MTPAARPRGTMVTLKIEQARGSYEVARYYQSKNKLDGALIYYNDVLLKAPESKYAQEARERIEAIKRKQQQAAFKPLPSGIEVPSLKNAQPPPAPPLDPPAPAKP